MPEDEGEDRLPIDLGPVSNGEYLPPPSSPVLRETERRAREAVDDTARRLGMSRRRFLRTSMAISVTLLALEACSSEERASRGKSPGGRMRLPGDSTTDPTSTLPPSDQFVMDVQTHFLDYTEHPDATDFGSTFPQSDCGDADSRLCFSIDHYLEELFLNSDTNMGIISAIPIPPALNALTIDDMERMQRVVERVCDDKRMLLHGQVLPSYGPLDEQLAGMPQLIEDHPIAAWKIYTHAPGRGWYLDDHDGSAPQVGNQFLERVNEVGPRIVSVHKGFSGGSEYASPVDIGPSAKAYPDIDFVVYHSGFESANREGPYDANGGGVDRFVRSLKEAGIGHGQNVYAELGSTWFLAMRDPDQAAHVLGKLLVAVGADNIVWGTDSIWYGSPQVQIDAFRAFEITEEYQDKYAYPPLTDDVKRKILGLNAAGLYGVDPITTSCEFSPADIVEARQALPARPASYGPKTAAAVRKLAHDHGWIGV